MKGKKFYYLFLFILTLSACEQVVDAPVVQAVYPSSQVVPENLLRIYVQFSSPMKTVGNIEKIKLFDENDKEVKNVFFNNAYELWNKEQTQLTLILDPARVKSGLAANATFGRALKPNRKYTLTIDALEDVNHQKMQKAFKKELNVVTADYQIPDTENWQFDVPKANTRDTYIVHFPQMLDYNSLKQRLIITDSKKNPIDGLVEIKKQETEWHFSPKEPWRCGNYILHVNSRLEDSAGNNMNGLFDHKVGELKYEKEGIIQTIPFEICKIDKEI
ncbi:MAG: hypothetical protein AAGA43_04330 [Bacteroidota bacterium]